MLNALCEDYAGRVITRLVNKDGDKDTQPSEAVIADEQCEPWSFVPAGRSSILIFQRRRAHIPAMNDGEFCEGQHNSSSVCPRPLRRGCCSRPGELSMRMVAG
jgi:hypothetical protein